MCKSEGRWRLVTEKQKTATQDIKQRRKPGRRQTMEKDPIQFTESSRNSNQE